jgi:hypothetical protein
MVLRGSSNMVGRRSEDVVGRGLVYAVDPVGWLVGRRSESALEGLERGSSDVFRRGSVGLKEGHLMYSEEDKWVWS